ncbi:MAG: hypothetical protein AAF806_22540 [Bacteroidota bacterium]
MKRIGIISLILLFTITIWYLFLKTNDFEVRMTISTAPGTVYKNVLDWNKGLNKGKSQSKIISKTPFEHLLQRYQYEDFDLELNWTIEALNDTASTVLIGINDQKNPLEARIKKLFGASPLEAFLEQEFSGLHTVLLHHLEQFYVVIEGEENSPKAFVAYMNISCHQDQKADQMIINSPYINTFLKENGLTISANPFLEIVHWDRYTGMVNFNFCFPIELQEELPVHEEIQYKKVPPKKSLKATFYGNYSYTDEAWFALEAYRCKHQYQASETIVEVFYENPHTTGLRDIEWEAAVYMAMK